MQRHSALLSTSSLRSRSRSFSFSIPSQTLVLPEQLEKIADRYPFHENELDQLLSCYESYLAGQQKDRRKRHASLYVDLRGCRSLDENDAANGTGQDHCGDRWDRRGRRCTVEKDSILIHLAISSPSLFSQEDTIRRVELCEHVILGQGKESQTEGQGKVATDLVWTPNIVSTSKLKDIIFNQAYVPFSCMPGLDIAIEAYLEGLAGCLGRRGPRQCLQIIYDCCLPAGDDKPKEGMSNRREMLTTGNENGEESLSERCINNVDLRQSHAKDLIGMCYRLSVASRILSSSSVYAYQMVSGMKKKKDLGVPSVLLESIVRFSNQSSPLQSSSNDPSNDFGTRKSIKVSRRDFLEWAETTVPSLSSTLSTFMSNLIQININSPSYGSSPAEFQMPDLGYQGTFLEDIYTEENDDSASDVGDFIHGDKSEKDNDTPTFGQLLFCLAAMAPEMGGKWHKLYSRDSHGTSFDILLASILGYDGPTVLLVHAANGGTFGAFTNCRWKESPNFYGNSECFLFRLDPCVNVYRSVGSATNYVYCSPSGNRGRGRCRGIGFGGDLKCPRLFIGDSDDSVCVASSFDKTYESGELLDDGWKIGERFRVEHLEVWAVGGEDAIEAGLKSRDMKRDVCEANIIKARTVVDKAGFLNDFTSGLIESKVWAHRAQARGRASYRADENHGGYTLDSSTGTKQQRL